MKKNTNRALNLFSAMDALPDSMVLEAEQALMEAEGGMVTPIKKPQSGFGRFLNSGWGAAVISGIVAIGVLIFIIRAGQNTTVTYEPPQKPAGGCTIEMGKEGVNYTLSMEQASYAEGTTGITVILTGRNKGEEITTAGGGWHLERLTENGAEAVEILYHTIAQMSHPSRNEYASLTCGMTAMEPLTVGTYRLHATEFDGEKYVSVAYCTFTVGDPTTPEDTTADGVETEVEYSPAEERLYTVTTPDGITYGAAGLSITVMAVEQGVSLVPHRNYRIVKLAGPANGEGAACRQTAEGVEIRPTPENGDYAVFEDWITLVNPDEWLPGIYRLYALNYDNEYVDYCDFAIKGEGNRSWDLVMTKTTITTADTRLPLQFFAYVKGQPLGRGDAWSVYRIEDGKRVLMGSEATEIGLEGAEVAPDEFTVEDLNLSISYATGGSHKTLPAGSYELVYTAASITLPFTVVEDPNPPLTTDDPEKMVMQGVFFWANGEPFIHLPTMGDVYPVRFTVENNATDFSGLTTGDVVEIIMGNYIEELFPSHSWLYELRKVSDGFPSDLPAAVRDAMTEAGYTVTEYPVGTRILTGYFLPDGPSGLLITDTKEVIYLRLCDGYEISFDGLTAGDRVEATTWDTILESWPEQTDLYALRKLSDGSVSDIPADILAKLEEAGWYQVGE